MYAEEAIEHMRWVQKVRAPELLTTKDAARKRHLAYAMTFTNQLITSMEIAQRYLLDVRQAEAFAHARLSFESFPPLAHHLTYIEFNGRLRFDYAMPYLQDGIATVDETPKFQYNNLKQKTEYRSVLITHCPPREGDNPVNMTGQLQDSFLPKDEWAIRAFWFEPLFRVPNGTMLDNFVITFTRSSWPNTHNDRGGEYLDPQSLRHRQRLMFMTCNLLAFITAENLTFVKIRPADHERYKLKGLPCSAQPYHVLPFQVPHYRYLHPHAAGSGSAHGHRYDVRGHFRHLRDECYARNPDGSTRVVWVAEHQRGLTHDVYVPALRRGTVGAEIVECDQFIRELEVMRSKRAS